MEDLIPNAIGIGLVVSLVFSETLGLAAGGMVVPGYIALNLTNPVAVLMTLVLGVVAYLIVRVMSTFMILFGRRRTVVIILVGFMLGMLFRGFMQIDLGGQTYQLHAIGYIIPGLVAMWLDRQGVVETSATLLTSGVLVKLLLIMIYGGEMYEWL
ncbi:MAG TPA: poly-gamma-glutamate biosynthesis protein PgsC [Myxococcota bacterium]|nr:poly-gamma-glutamate biosynthesis protein PgsC [Myxococcota bacterium]HRY95940.1 poly-gamma-glutamate biosynthesis protein PgsC [Myxococcota bacterium]